MKKTTLTAIALALGIAADVNASIRPDMDSDTRIIQIRYSPYGGYSKVEVKRIDEQSIPESDPRFMLLPTYDLLPITPMNAPFLPEGEWGQTYISMRGLLQRILILMPTFQEEETHPEGEAYEGKSDAQRPATYKENKRRNRKQRRDIETTGEEYSSRRSEKTPKAEETYGSERERTSYRDEAPVAEAPAVRSTSMSMYDPSAIQWGTNDSLGDPDDFKTRVMRGKKYWNASGFELDEECMRFIHYVICDESSSVEVLDLCNSGVNDSMARILFNNRLIERRNPLRVLLQENKLTPKFLQQIIGDIANSQIQVEF